MTFTSRESPASSLDLLDEPLVTPLAATPPVILDGDDELPVMDEVNATDHGTVSVNNSRAQMEATPQPSVASPSSPSADDIISINALSQEMAAPPGTTVEQRFRVSNAFSMPVTVLLRATISKPDWQATLYHADSHGPIDAGYVVIPAASSIDVVVRITIPPEAYAGERVTTRLTAILLASGDALATPIR